MFGPIRHLFRVVHSQVRESIKARSGEWRAVERAHLAAQPSCAACGGTARLQVHHIRPFHLDPKLELDPANLLTMCMGPLECHFRIGHGGSFKFFDPNVVADAAEARTKPKHRANVEAQARAARLSVDPLA